MSTLTSPPLLLYLTDNMAFAGSATSPTPPPFSSALLFIRFRLSIHPLRPLLPFSACLLLHLACYLPSAVPFTLA